MRMSIFWGNLAFLSKESTTNKIPVFSQVRIRSVFSHHGAFPPAPGAVLSPTYAPGRCAAVGQGVASCVD